MDLVTSRLVLSTPRIADLGAFKDALSNSEVARQLIQLPTPFTFEHARGWFRWQKDGRKSGDVFAWCIQERGALVGSIVLRRTSATGFDLGYWIGRPHWGKGLCFEAASAVVDFARGERLASQLAAVTLSANLPSVRVLKKLGFGVTGFAELAAMGSGRMERCTEFALPL